MEVCMSIRVTRFALVPLILSASLAAAHSLEDADALDAPGIPPAMDVDAMRFGRWPRTPRPPRPPFWPRPGKFRLQEATIADIHSAFHRRELTCRQLIRLYFRRIKHYSGHCVKYDTNGDGVSPDYDFFMPSGKGVYLGVVSTIPNAGRINALQSLNLRPVNYAALGFAPPHDPGPRSETDLVDADPSLPDALETAAMLDAEYRNTSRIRPLHCIPIVIKDQMETKDLRTTDGSLTQFANDRPSGDGTLVRKLREAGAIILAKSAMDEYAAGTHRSSYAGQMCNPYATDRDAGSSSTGSATAVSANLAVCGIAEESLGSVREPGKKSHVVAMTASRGLVSRAGSWPAELIRERYGPECRTVADLARVLEVIRGYDPLDPVTATQIGFTPTVSYATFTQKPSLAGRRLGIVREFMPNITVNDTDSIRVFNEEVIPVLRAAGADLVESVNPRDIVLGWSVDDPTIPNIDIQSIVAEMIPTLEPSFANPSTLNTPSITTGLTPNNLRIIFDPVGALFPTGTDLITKSVEMFYGVTPFPSEISLRQLDRLGAGTLNQGRYGIEKMLVGRGDTRVKSVLDLSIDFEDLDGDGDTTEHISFFRIGDDGTVVQRNRIGVTPNVGVPATPAGLTLDTQGQATHVYRQQAIREIVARIMADYDLDALVYPYETIPSKILTGTVESIAWLTYDGRPNRGINGFTDGSGLPDIGVPAGFTKVVYDRTTRGSSADLAVNPPSVKREVMLPFSVQFMGGLWSEPTLLEIAAAYEAARGPRMPPPDFGPIPGEP
jgi:Asp-tRNA(Asn)/Glu-tRNA(Gln) amidotransferase A subunit family amidase